MPCRAGTSFLVCFRNSVGVQYFSNFVARTRPPTESLGTRLERGYLLLFIYAAQKSDGNLTCYSPLKARLCDSLA